MITSLSLLDLAKECDKAESECRVLRRKLTDTGDAYFAARHKIKEAYDKREKTLAAYKAAVRATYDSPESHR